MSGPVSRQSIFSNLMDFFQPKPAKPARSKPAKPPKPQTSLRPQDKNGTRPLAKGSAQQCQIIQPEDSHVHQYSHDKNLKSLSSTAKQREAQANCGPSSAAIVLRSMGLKAGSLHGLRQEGGAITGNRSASAYAIDPYQLMEMVKGTAAEQGHQVGSSLIELPAKAEDAWKVLQGRMYTGMPTVLLTGNMSSSGPGHYVVINSARNGQLSINDPQFESGHNTNHDFAEFKAAFERRQRSGKGNFLISFMPDLSKLGGVK